MRRVRVAIRADDGSLEDLIMSTNDLSGCTVAVVSSPFAAIMIHVWERRAGRNDNNTWLTDPYGPAQQAEDAEFISKGVELMTGMLAGMGGSVADGYNGFFPAESTSVLVPVLKRRGRPPGSKNKIKATTESNISTPKKRGRSKGSEKKLDSLATGIT